MEFEKLKLEEEGSWFSRFTRSPHTRKTLLYIFIGAIAGFLLFVVTEGESFNTLTTGEVLKSMAVGGFFGFFITNSPCARNRC